MARAKKGAAGSLAATPQTAAPGAPADAGAPAPNPDQSVNEAVQVPGAAGDQSQTAAANETVQMPGAAPAVVVPAGDPGNDPAEEIVPLNPVAPEAQKPETKPLDGLISVKSHRPRRRAGLAFGPEAVTIDTAELTDEQLLAITGDPLLEVTEAE